MKLFFIALSLCLISNLGIKLQASKKEVEENALSSVVSSFSSPTSEDFKKTETQIDKITKISRNIKEIFIPDILNNIFGFLNFRESIAAETVNKDFQAALYQKADKFSLLWEISTSEDSKKSVTKALILKCHRAELAHNKLKALRKTNHKALNAEFIEPLNVLARLAEEEGSLKADRKYFMHLQGVTKGSLEDFESRKILSKKAVFRDKLIAHYRSKIEENKDDSKSLDYFKYKLAKFLSWANADDPQNKRKIEFLSLVRELEGRNFAKAYYLHYKALKKMGKDKYLHLKLKAEELGYKSKKIVSTDKS